MIKTVEDVSIVINADLLVLTNKKNKCQFHYNSKSKRFFFQDSNDNIIQNYGATISINFKVYNLTFLRQTINMTNGSMIAYLIDKDIQELAERTFYEERQIRIYDFAGSEMLNTDRYGDY
ncbi:hypothetical protein KHA90_09120 [Flavobacterium psychroterrae]|uniref:Uncharacterized protein n=1 Tax=Flavobacterium psychroterrae TaxID=2133767 RepID=A0ABS5PBS1_9FLAO|nr:hypothetical protein [Flavobacterium psychroterrae]MBS7231186.1 hypothetical protein [Flavobacterium psychroterrae]